MGTMKTAAFAIVCLLLFVGVSTQDTDDKCGEWRLPRDVLPTHYEITLRIPAESQNRTFTGSEKIEIACYKKTDTIVLHNKNLNITTSLIIVQPKYGDGKSLRVVNSTTDTERDLVRLKLEAQIPKNGSYVLNIPEYSGTIDPWGQRGLFLEWESPEAKQDRVVYSTFFEPASAREVFPCFDEPDMKATFTVHIERSGKYKSYSNMPLNNTIKVSPDRYLDTFDKSPPIPTYVLGVTVNDYGKYPQNDSGRTYIFVPEEELKDVEGVYKVANEALLEMEKYTNIPYPLSKLDHIGVADYKFEGMEHWGLIIYPRSVLRKMVSEEALDIERSVHVIVHEIAHQWFGNLVTMDWWSHFWLNEAFPTYFEYYLGDKIFPEWRFSDRFIISEFQKALDYDEGEEGVPIPLSSKNICNVNEYFQELINVSYRKGASILRMFRSILGSEERFQKALRTLLQNGMLKNIKPNDFFGALDGVNQQLEKSHLPQGVSFKDVGVQWTEQAGVPLVTVTRNYTAGTVHLKQERFLKGNDSTRWFIPLTWTTASSLHVDPLDGPQDWLNEDKTITMNIRADDWLLVNTNVTGYFRVNYDDENWSLLARALENSPQRFSVANRAQLLNDAVALNQAKLLNFDIAYNMTRFLRSEDDRVVWMSAAKLLIYLYYQCMDINLDPDHTKKLHIHRIASRAYDMVSITLQPPGHQQSHLDHAMRETISTLASTARVKSAHDDIYHQTLPDWLEGKVYKGNTSDCVNV